MQSAQFLLDSYKEKNVVSQFIFSGTNKAQFDGINEAIDRFNIDLMPMLHIVQLIADRDKEKERADEVSDVKEILSLISKELTEEQKMTKQLHDSLEQAKSQLDASLSLFMDEIKTTLSKERKSVDMRKQIPTVVWFDESFNHLINHVNAISDLGVRVVLFNNLEILYNYLIKIPKEGILCFITYHGGGKGEQLIKKIKDKGFSQIVIVHSQSVKDSVDLQRFYKNEGAWVAMQRTKVVAWVADLVLGY